MRTRCLQHVSIPRGHKSHECEYFSVGDCLGTLMTCFTLLFLALALLARCCRLARLLQGFVTQAAGGRAVDAENCHIWMPKMGKNVFLWMSFA